MCYACYKEKQDSVYSGEIHLTKIGDDIYLGKGGGDETPTHLRCVTANKKITIPTGKLRGTGRKVIDETIPVSEIEAHYLTRAIYRNGYESAKEHFQLT